MKKLIISFIVLFAITSACAQDKERFTFGILSGLPDANTHNDTYDYGFNVGLRTELQLDNELIYLKGGVYYFPGLNDLPYFDFDGGVGLNWRSDNDVWRVYGGGFTGLINRDNAWHLKFGLELGFDIYIYEGFYIGAIADTQYRHDDKVWKHNDSGHNVQSFNVVIGYSWYFNN